jgi:hypothetical protein
MPYANLHTRFQKNPEVLKPAKNKKVVKLFLDFLIFGGILGFILPYFYSLSCPSLY